MVILRPMESDQKNEPVCGICKFDDWRELGWTLYVSTSYFEYEFLIF